MIHVQATTAARVAYSAVALTIIGYPLLDKIEAIRTAPVPKPRSGGVTAELEAAAAAGAAAAAAALKGTRLYRLPTRCKCNNCTCVCVHTRHLKRQYSEYEEDCRKGIDMWLLPIAAGARAKKGSEEDTINTRNKATRR